MVEPPLWRPQGKIYMPGSFVFRVSLVPALALAAICAEPSVSITTNQPRPMLELARALVDHYGYLVTYEDAPADVNREVQTYRRADGVEQRRLIRKAMTFHLTHPADGGAPVRVPHESNTEVSQRMERSTMEALLNEYHASGNFGRFTVLSEQDYTHIVPAGRSVNGRYEAFQPILSTIVPVSRQDGLCIEVFEGLLAELRQLRGVTIVGAALPFQGLFQRQCLIRGHDLPARTVLIQLLEQLGSDPRTGLPEDRFTWSLVHDPTSDSYFLSTRLALPNAGVQRQMAVRPDQK